MYFIANHSTDGLGTPKPWTSNSADKDSNVSISSSMPDKTLGNSEKYKIIIIYQNYRNNQNLHLS